MVLLASALAFFVPLGFLAGAVAGAAACWALTMPVSWGHVSIRLGKWVVQSCGRW